MMTDQKKAIIKIARFFLKLFVDQVDHDSLIGDLDEMYEIQCQERGRLRAGLWYRSQIIKAIPSSIFNKIESNLFMFTSYLKVALRSVKRHKTYSFINITGLAVGMACSILVLLWIQDELSYDRFHQNGDHIYRVIFEGQIGDDVSRYAITPNGFGPDAAKIFPEIIRFTRFQSFTEWLVSYGDNVFQNDRLAVADPDLFEMFRFPFIKGDPKTALDEKFSVVMTERMARKYFGDEDPMGKTINIGRGSADFKVTGVIENLRRNSHMKFDCVFPISHMEFFWNQNLQSWEQIRFVTYLQVHENSSVVDLTQDFQELVKTYQPVLPAKNVQVMLQPLKKIHLYSNFREDEVNIGKGSITYVIIFSVVALCILVVACINFTNLATARSATRSKEVGMRKVAGAHRGNLIKQFLVESTMLSAIALLLALVLANILLPVFNDLSGKQITMDFSDNGLMFIGLMGITLFTGLVSGSYPALFISSFEPIRILKDIGSGKIGHSATLRKILVVLQFVFTIILIIATTVVYRQLKFIQYKDLGFDKHNVVYFEGEGQFVNSYEAARQELLKYPNILSVSRAHPPIYLFGGTSEVNWEGKTADTEIVFQLNRVDYDYIRTFGMDMFEGRSFSREFSTDLSNYLLNETAVKMMGIENPVGKRFSYKEEEGIIIGVVRDYHQGSLHRRIEPVLFKLRAEDHHNYICVKMHSEYITETLDFLEDKYRSIAPGYPFFYRFLDETIDSMYRNEQEIGTVIRYFTLLSIFISCIGLLGLAAFTAEQRTKEIGIRKVFGASISGILLMLSKEFIQWVIVANIIAWPITYFAVKRLLRAYVYRISLGPDIFVISGLFVLILTLLIVSYQSIRAATANPVDSLRYE